jgi:hypothetical protein
MATFPYSDAKEAIRTALAQVKKAHAFAVELQWTGERDNLLAYLDDAKTFLENSLEELKHHPHAQPGATW